MPPRKPPLVLASGPSPKRRVRSKPYTKRDRTRLLLSQISNSTTPPSSPCHISKLPTELLSLIFAFAKTRCGTGPRVLCLVSRAWHGVGLATAELWADIVVDPFRDVELERVGAWLERSKSVAIDLVLDFTRLSAPGGRGAATHERQRRVGSEVASGWTEAADEARRPTGAYLRASRQYATPQSENGQIQEERWKEKVKRVLHAGHLARCKSIVVRGASCHAIIAAISILKYSREYEAKHLERFEIDTICDAEKCNKNVPWLATEVKVPEHHAGEMQKCRFTYLDLAEGSFFQLGAPLLTHLSLSALSIPCTYIPSNNVRTLSLSSNGRWTHSDHLATLLAKFPNLLTLHLHHDTSVNWLTPGTQPIPLLELQTLRLTGKHVELRHMLSRLHTPCLEHLIVEDFSREHADLLWSCRARNVFGAEGGRYPVLTALTLRGPGVSGTRHDEYLSHRHLDRDSVAPRTLSLKRSTGFSYAEVLKESVHAAGIEEAARCLPNIQELVINDALLADAVYALAPKKGVGRVAWPELKKVTVEAFMPHFELKVALQELLKSRKKRGVPIKEIEMDYNDRRVYWDMKD
ncbi:hypothetical protein AX16_010726 [Volvariella volvacea WC 439]|nr:hypothetical protein AX16_010726 [Volvariella volvacea WC 439]